MVLEKSISSNLTEGNIGDIARIYQLGLNYEIVNIFHWFMYGAVCQMIGLFGIITNIMSIICFIKQGFSDPINVSFLGLSIADLGCLVTVIFGTICLTPGVSTADLPFNPIETTYLVSVMPRAAFTRVTGWITAIITLERCLCIAAPLKVKSIVTTKRMSILVACVFIILIPSGVPVYFVSKLAIKFLPERNRTVVGLVFTEHRKIVETVTFTINNFIIPFSAFILVTICTITLVIELRKKAKWRKESTTGSHADAISNRNRKVAKMVILISTLFIVSFIPVSVSFVTMALEPEFAMGGKYWYILTIIVGLGIFLESINSSANIFVYYHMSSKYKYIFQNIFFKKNVYAE